MTQIHDFYIGKLLNILNFTDWIVWKINFNNILQDFFVTVDLIDCCDSFSKKVNFVIFDYLYAFPKIRW